MPWKESCLVGSPTLARAYELRGHDILALADHELRIAKALAESHATDPVRSIRTWSLVAVVFRLVSPFIAHRHTVTTS
jgi:hypothetical protein